MLDMVSLSIPHYISVAGAQIWSIETALLLTTCRGHEAEITDLALSAGNDVAASSSNDSTIRCWSLKVVTNT